MAADIGSAFTKVYLLEAVEGERRIVAVGRVPTVRDDGLAVPAMAVEAAVQQALSFTGRSIPTEPASRSLLTSLVSVPRVLIIAAAEEAIHAVQTALASLPVHVLAPAIVDTGAEQLLARLEAEAPEALLLVVRKGEYRLMRAVLEAVQYGTGATSPAVVLLGDTSSFTADDEALARLSAITVEGVAPEAVAGAVGQIVTKRVEQLVSDEPGLVAWARRDSSLAGVCTATEIIAERYDVDVLTLDLGASHAMGVLVNGTFRQRQVTTAARDDLGIRRGRCAILDRAGAASLTRWLPTEIPTDMLRADARRLATVPAALPESLDALLLDHAYAREALRLVAADLAQTVRGGQGLPPIDLLIGSGGLLAAVPRLMQAVLIMLDAVQPGALTQLALDRTTALPLLGHLGATLNQDAVGASLERDGLLNLGLCIAPMGAGREGETAIKVEVAYATRSSVTVEVPYGAIEVVPLPLGERASLKLWPAREFDIGLGRGNAATPRAEVEGGAVGIIVDARGRPLGLPEQPEKRQAKLLQWLQSTRAYPQLSFIQDRPLLPHEAPESESAPSTSTE